MHVRGKSALLSASLRAFEATALVPSWCVAVAQAPAKAFPALLRCCAAWAAQSDEPLQLLRRKLKGPLAPEHLALLRGMAFQVFLKGFKRVLKVF